MTNRHSRDFRRGRSRHWYRSSRCYVIVSHNLRRLDFSTRLNLHEEVAEAAYVRASRADFVVEIGAKRHTCSAWRNNVHAVSGEAAVVAEVDGCVGALLNFGDRSGESNTGNESGEDD